MGFDHSGGVATMRWFQWL